MSQKHNSKVTYTTNFVQNATNENLVQEAENYIVSPDQDTINESFEGNLGKAITMDNSYKAINGKIIRSHGINSNANRSSSRYSGNEENDGVATTGTWDMRKSSSYVTKAYKHPKNSSYVKNPTSYHKKNKSQHNTRMMPSRASSSLASYNFNTNRSNALRQSKKETWMKKSDSDKKLNLKYVSKWIKQKVSRHPSTQQKTEGGVKNYPIKKNASSKHVRNTSAVGLQKQSYH